VILLLVARFGVKAVVPGFAGFALGMQWALGLALVVFLWWLLLSRAPWRERVGIFVVMAGGLAAAWFLRHESMGPLWLFAYAIPVLCVALVGGLAATRRLPDRSRIIALTAILLVACGMWTLARTEGISGDHVATFGWRWVKTPEERLLAAPAAKPAASGAALTVARVEWPGFRGPERNGISRGVRIETNWSASPPVELWRRPIGPGWSSFAVHDDLLYTQEQRGNDEVVACYKTTTGAPIWIHKDTARFFESNGGAGPRGTPTLADDRVYTFGPTGIVNALDAGSGAVAWSHNAASDLGAEVPIWGFSSSPLVVDDLVIVAVSGQLIAYNAATGTKRWTGPKSGGSYSSPQLMTLDGTAQIVLVGGAGATGVSPADGRQLWAHAWKGLPIVQPAVTPDGDVLLAVGTDSGTRRLAVTHKAGGWNVAERWTSNGLKPYFNDFVVHKGHAYGFDGRILACIDLADGARRWKGGRYGNGQLVLLSEQDLLLVLSEEGELALVRATPDRFTEVAKFKAIEGKTWNHPAMAGDILLVRNGEEMAAFRLPLSQH
jgi:outer membrane protein assembly factor BamB